MQWILNICWIYSPRLVKGFSSDIAVQASLHWFFHPSRGRELLAWYLLLEKTEKHLAHISSQLIACQFLIYSTTPQIGTFLSLFLRLERISSKTKPINYANINYHEPGLVLPISPYKYDTRIPYSFPGFFASLHV